SEIGRNVLASRAERSSGRNTQMATELKITKCEATPSNLIVYFSDGLDTSKPATTNSASYTVTAVDNTATVVVLAGSNPAYDVINKATVLQLDPSKAAKGTWLKVTVSGLTSTHGSSLASDPEIYFVIVNGEKSEVEENSRRATKAVEDSVAYPIMTEQVGNPPSSSYGGGTGTGGGGVSGSGSLPLSQLATQTITN